MLSAVQSGNHLYTTGVVCEQLSNSALLPQLLSEMVIDEILVEWDTAIDDVIPDSRSGVA